MEKLTPQQLQAAIKRNQARVVDLLHWTLEDYAVHLYNCGMQYLTSYMGKDEAAIAAVEGRKEFWNWWMLLFNARDEAFVEEWDGLEDSINVHDLRSIYYDLHSPSLLACEIKPPAMVYGKNFINPKMAAV